MIASRLKSSFAIV